MPAAVGILTTPPCCDELKRSHWCETKKKSLSFLIGPPTLKPKVFSRKMLFGVPAMLLALSLAFNEEFWSRSQPSPCKLLVPLLYTRLLTEPPALPNSAA